MMQTYNPYTPYNPYQPMYQQPFQQVTQPVAQQQTPQTIQNGGFVSVRSEMEARSYPVAPGNSITFKNENEPYVYVKTKGFSQLEEPVFERFRLVREDAPPQTSGNAPQSGFNGQEGKDITDLVNGEIMALKSAYSTLRADIDEIKRKMSEEAETDESQDT